MLEKVISLFERLVVAQETIAAAQSSMTNVVVEHTVKDPEKAKQATKPAETKKAETKKAETKKPVEKPKPTLADVKAAVKAYAASREGVSADTKADARALMAHHAAGAMATNDISEEYYQDVIDACNAGWEPINTAAADEDL